MAMIRYLQRLGSIDIMEFYHTNICIWSKLCYAYNKYLTYKDNNNHVIRIRDVAVNIPNDEECQ